jgi:hypothetical protein
MSPNWLAVVIRVRVQTEDEQKALQTAASVAHGTAAFFRFVVLDRMGYGFSWNFLGR